MSNRRNLDSIIGSFVPRYEDKGDGKLIMRQVKVRENKTIPDARFQVEYDISKMRFTEENDE